MKCSKCGRDIRDSDIRISVRTSGYYCYVKIKCKCGNYHVEELRR